MAVLREWGIPATVMVPEPNTWREILAAIAGRPERKIVIQGIRPPGDGSDRGSARPRCRTDDRSRLSMGRGSLDCGPLRGRP